MGWNRFIPDKMPSDDSPAPCTYIVCLPVNSGLQICIPNSIPGFVQPEQVRKGNLETIGLRRIVSVYAWIVNAC